MSNYADDELMMAWEAQTGTYQPNQKAGTELPLPVDNYKSVDPQYVNAAQGDWQSRHPRWAAAADLTRQAGPEALLGAAVSAGQLALQAAPTTHSKEQERRLNELLAKREQGRLGLDEQERQIMERQQLSPVRAIAGEQQMRDEAAMASSGNFSAAARDASLRRGRDAVAEQARRAGLAIAQQDLVRKRQQEREIEELHGYKSMREIQNREFMAQALAGLAEPFGTAMAGRAVAEVDMDGLIRKFGVTDAMAIRAAVARGEFDPREANQLATTTLLTGGDVGGQGAGPQ